MNKIIPLFFMTLLMASCHQSSGGDNAMYDTAAAKEEMIPQAADAAIETTSPVDKVEKTEVNKKRIIKDGRLGIRVSDLEKSKSRMDTLVKSNGGYYANESFNNSDYESSYILKVRIPTDKFEKFISEIESGDGEIQYKEIDARDVTDQFIDLETRLDNKRNYLIRYKDLLSQAKNVEEILQIEEKIRGLEEEIESTTGRLKYLGDLVDYSTLDLTISKQKDFKYNPGQRDKFTEKLKQSLSRGWYGGIDFLLFTIKIWPFWIIVTLIFYFLNKLRNRRKNKS